MSSLNLIWLVKSGLYRIYRGKLLLVGIARQKLGLDMLLFYLNQWIYQLFLVLAGTIWSTRNKLVWDKVVIGSFWLKTMSGATEMHNSNGVEGMIPEDLAYEVCRYSLLKRSSPPLEIIPIKQSELHKNGVNWRERAKLESTEFSFLRFLTPFLANYENWAMFVDCDFLYLHDIKDLVELVDDKYTIMWVQHDYAPKETTKMDRPRANGVPEEELASMVLYNCGHFKNRVLTPEVVNKETGAFLHRFQWLEDDEIGEVPFVWNFLVGHNKIVEGDQKRFPRAIHYTLGGPWFEQWKDCEFGELWLNELVEYKKVIEKKAF
ncbi:hypothetical protein BUALT_Bualt02G0112600 [Buddleja alternifolia]|uniref:Glycosyltransferase n=1 Tax=Buddleja alternifolia TaxID=168488 RepID=A0AAV6YA05_9LAMI|nr:hypothetical protein BUALT_Bualt02G0112600 [Buddleja alternifolia]